MNEQDPWAQLDAIAGPEGAEQSAPQTPQQAPASPAQAQTQPAAQQDAWAQLDALAGAEGQPATPKQPQEAQGFPAFASQGELNDYYTKMLQDRKVPTQRIRDFFAAMGSKISPDIDRALQGRDEFFKNNKEGSPAIVADPDHVAERLAPGEIGDNRERSYWQGVWNGAEDVVGNVLGGANWLSDQVGMTNTLGRDARAWIEENQRERTYQGEEIGNMIGRGITALPTMALSAPIEGGAAAVGLPIVAARGLGLLGEGAVAGAVTTNGETPGEVVRDAAIGAGVNLGLGGLGDIATRRLARGIAPTDAAAQGREVLDAANRLSRDGIQINATPAMTGGTFARGVDAVAEAGLVSNIPVARAKDAVQDGLEAARDRAVRSMLPDGVEPRGINAVAADVLNAPGGLGKYAEESKAVADDMFEKAFQSAGDVEIQTPKTLARLNQIIAKLEKRPGDVPGLSKLKELRDDLTPVAGQPAKGGLLARLLGRATAATPGNEARFTIESLRDLRTSFGDNFDANQRSIATVAKRLWGPLSDDIENGLRAAGKGEAAKLFREADSFYSQRLRNIEDIVNPALGNRSSEQLGNNLVAMSRNKSQELDNALALMNPDLAAQVRAGIVQDLGRANSGAQNAAGTAFSPNVFARDWDSLVQANSGTFTGGQAGQDLADIARVGQGMREGGALRNGSGTGRVANAFANLKGATSLGLGLATAGKSALGEAVLGGIAQSTTLARAGVRLGEARPVTKTTLRSIQHGAKAQVPVTRAIENGIDDDEAGSGF